MLVAPFYVWLYLITAIGAALGPSKFHCSDHARCHNDRAACRAADDLDRRHAEVMLLRVAALWQLASRQEKHAMRLLQIAVSGVLAGVLLAGTADSKARLSDTQVRQRIIRASIADYPGNCPCPYNAARNGSRCGRRSAWDRAGGYAPMCYASDVTKTDVRNWRASH